MPAELTDLLSAYNGLVDELEEEGISRRQMEEKLRSEKDFIATTLNPIANPVIVVDSRGAIKLANPGAQRQQPFAGFLKTDARMPAARLQARLRVWVQAREPV